MESESNRQLEELSAFAELWQGINVRSEKSLPSPLVDDCGSLTGVSTDYGRLPSLSIDQHSPRKEKSDFGHWASL